MSKVNKYLKLQLDTEFKKDAENCIKIKNKLKELEGAVWSSEWRILVNVIFKGYPYDDRIYKPSKIGYIFLEGIKDNPVPSLDSITIGEYETILYALEEMNLYPGLSGKAYKKLIKKLKKLQNGVETDKVQPK